MIIKDTRVTEYYEKGSRIWHNFDISYKSKQKENSIIRNNGFTKRKYPLTQITKVILISARNWQMPIFTDDKVNVNVKKEHPIGL